MGILSSKTKEGPPADVITTPQTGYSFVSPYMEDYSRRLLASYFGSPGEYQGLISQPKDIPIEQTAGLTPLQIQARQEAAGLGDYQASLDRASGLFGKQEQNLDTAMGYLPQAQAGIQEGMGFQREGSQLARGAGRFSDAAERMIGTGADTVAGGIGALQRAEQSALGSTQMFDPMSASRFMDPYEDQVVQQTLEDINRASAQQDIGLRDRAISQGAFGGSRGRISQEELARQTGRGAAEAIGALRSQGFGQSLGSAQQAFESQQGRQAGLGSMQAGLGGQQAAIGAQQAALGSQMAGLGSQQVARGQALGGFGSNIAAGGQALGGLGSMQAGLGQQYGQIGQGIAGLGQQGQSQLGAQIGMLNQLGQQGQATQQAALSRQFTGAQQLAGEPMQRLMQGQQLLAGSPMGGISGGTGTSAYQRGSYQEPSSFSKALGAAGTIATIVGMSDLELKTNIKKVGELEPGINWYTWDWNEKGKALGAESEPAEGVLAQEVLEVKPDAVIVKDGYYAVDYSKVM
jgi:hypothetical protein|tara:strand:+ start:278 stop:1831 length:1554 start_codon:yes stop_codon:yes gene_type:complete